MVVRDRGVQSGPGECKRNELSHSLFGFVILGFPASSEFPA